MDVITAILEYLGWSAIKDIFSGWLGKQKAEQKEQAKADIPETDSEWIDASKRGDL